jgi:hypothetical protein
VFNQFKCGCIVGDKIGKVTICSKHTKGAKSEDDDEDDKSYGKIVKSFPANGTTVANWSGK